MLYKIRSLRCVRSGKTLPPRDVWQTPDLAKYVQGWGRTSDRRFVALESKTPIGAAWYRLSTADRPGYGYVNDTTPEIAIALLHICTKNSALSKLAYILFKIGL